MKKICVVTWCGGTNYGTNLQAFALLKKLELLGYDVKLKGSITGNFNYLCHLSFVVDRIINKLRIRIDRKNKNILVADQLKEKKFKEFCIQYLPRLNSHGRREWKKIEDEFLAFITGSDQVWNPNYFQSGMMLDFIKTDKIKKIAYAPSIGVRVLSQKIRATYKRLLASYSAIGVREIQAAKLIRDISPVPVKVVLDPTLLLTEKDWDSFIESADIDVAWGTNESYILCYFVGDRKGYCDYVNLVKKMTGLSCIVIPMEVDMSTYGKVAFGVGPKEFVWLIKHSSIVCTDSFHATVFSMIYRKEFYVLKRFDDNSQVSQNGRLYEILDTFKLRNRLVIDEKTFHRDSNINYVTTLEIWNEKRRHSEEFLLTSLEK